MFSNVNPANVSDPTDSRAADSRGFIVRGRTEAEFARYVNAGYAKPRDPSVQYARRGREPLGNFLTTVVRGAAQRGNNLQARVAVRNIPKLNGKRLFGTRPRTLVRARAPVP
jgi:hypothetical protein